MDAKNENPDNWEVKFLDLAKGGWGKVSNISLDLVKKAGIEPQQYEHIYNKLCGWKLFHIHNDPVALWQIQLLSGEEHYFEKHASMVRENNESILLYAVWSGNLTLAKKYYQINPDDFFNTQFGFTIGFFAVCSQNIEVMEWVKQQDPWQLKMLKDSFSVAAMAGSLGCLKSLQWLCDFDLDLMNSREMFYLLARDNVLLPLLGYLKETSHPHLLKDYKYLAYYAVEYHNIPLYKWIVAHDPELLNQQILPANMNLLQFAAYRGSDELFSLVFNNQKDLIGLKDKNGLGFMEYAFLSSAERVNYTLGLSASGYCFSVNVPNKCEVDFKFGKFSVIRGMTMRSNFRDFAESMLKLNYRLQGINLPDGLTKKDGHLLRLILENRALFEKEAKIATTLWLLLKMGTQSENCLWLNFPNECIQLIFKSCFMEARKPQNRYMSFFNDQSIIRAKEKDLIAVTESTEINKPKPCFLF